MAVKKKVAPKKESVSEDKVTKVEDITTAVAPHPTIRTFKADDLEDAANLLLRAVPDFIKLGVEKAAEALRLTVWQEVCGMLVFCFNNGTLVSPQTDPSWLTDAPLIQDELVCQNCGGVFKPKARRQLYCSNACGEAAALKAKHV